MRKFLVMAAGMFMCLSASAQFYYQDSKNVDMLRHAKPADAARREIVIPGVNGFNVYKADTLVVYTYAVVIHTFTHIIFTQDMWDFRYFL